MSSGQYRVLVLLGVLLGLEILRSSPVRDFFNGLLAGFKNTPITDAFTKAKNPDAWNKALNPNYPPGSKGSKPQ